MKKKLNSNIIAFSGISNKGTKKIPLNFSKSNNIIVMDSKGDFYKVLEENGYDIIHFKTFQKGGTGKSETAKNLKKSN